MVGDRAFLPFAEGGPGSLVGWGALTLGLAERRDENKPVTTASALVFPTLIFALKYIMEDGGLSTPCCMSPKDRGCQVILAAAKQLQHEARNLRGLFMRLLLSLSTLFAGAVLAAVLPMHADPPALAKAKSAEAEGRFEEATQQYQAILKGTPSLVEARLGLGRSLANLAHCEEADKVLQWHCGIKSAPPRGGNRGRKVLFSYP